MATDLSARICANCSNASICPHKDVFMKLYENRDKLMIKCGDPDHPFDDNVDTSKEITVRVQHRYLDGPALEKLYRDLGLNGFDCACVAAYSGCPLMQHCAFDVPVYAPYPHAVGYPFNRSAKDSKGNNLEYVAPVATPRTNEVHATPWLSCTNCARYSECHEDIDYAKLGGTVYSTFGYSDVKVKVGDTIHLADIPTPKTIMPGYYRADRNPEIFTVASEEDKLIIYYSIQKPQMMARSFAMDGPIWMTMDEIKEAGLMHDVELFYNDLCYLYPSDGTTTLPMKIFLEGIICGKINRQSKDGEVVCVTGDYVPMTKTHNEIEPMYDSNDHILIAKDQLVASYTGEKISIMDDGIKIHENDNIIRYDINTGNYRKLSLVESDRLVIGMFIDANYKLDISMMRMLNYGEDLQMEITEDFVVGDERYVRLIVEVPEDDTIVNPCLTRNEYFEDPVNFQPINYLKTWDPFSIAMNTPPITVINDTVAVRTYRPLAPRKWAQAVVADRTPLYADDVPPTSQYIVRPFFDLIGYTDEARQRLKFDPTINVMKPMQCTYPSEIRFIDTMDDVYGVYWAMWALVHDRVTAAMDDTFKTVKDPLHLKEHTHVEGEFVAKVADRIETPIPGLPATMKLTDPVHVFDLDIEHTPNSAKTMYEWMKRLDLPDNFNARMYALPMGTNDLTLHSNYTHEHVEPVPHGQVTFMQDGFAKTTTLENLEITDVSVETFENQVNQTYIVVVYPKTAAGMTQYCQNFVAYQINATQQPIFISATFVMNGKDMMLNFIPVIAFEKARAYRLNGVYVEDIEDVYLEVHGNVLSLAGDKAIYYMLDNHCEVKYEQMLTVKTGYINMPVDDEANYTITYRDAAEFDFLPPEKDSIIRISVDDVDVMKVVDREVVLNPVCLPDETSIAIEKMDDVYGHYHVRLHNISGDHTIYVVYREGGDGTVEGCPRCREYVDVSEYPFEWTPECEHFKPLRCGR